MNPTRNHITQSSELGFVNLQTVCARAFANFQTSHAPCSVNLQACLGVRFRQSANPHPHFHRAYLHVPRFVDAFSIPPGVGGLQKPDPRSQKETLGPDSTPHRGCGGRTGLGRSSRFPAGFGCTLGRVKSTFACRSPTGSIRAPGCGVRAGARSKRAQPAAVHTWRAARHPFELALLPLYKTQRPTLRYALSMGGRRTRARFRIIEAQAKTVGI
jgi:hypothetical protein